jgi:hypothetical protein
MGRNIWNESILERDLIFQMEYDRDVVSYREQAVRIFFELDGKRRFYTPDFSCELRNRRPQIIEVKPKAKLSSWFKQLYRIITPICDREGFDFLVYTEFQIRIQPLLDNIKCLWKYARTPIYPFHQVLCHDCFSTRTQRTLCEVFEFFAKRAVDKQVVLALLYWGVISTDLMIPLGADSPVRYESAAITVPEAAV